MTFTCRVCLTDSTEAWCDTCGKRIVPLPVNDRDPRPTLAGTASGRKEVQV